MLTHVSMIQNSLTGSRVKRSNLKEAYTDSAPPDIVQIETEDTHKPNKHHLHHYCPSCTTRASCPTCATLTQTLCLSPILIILRLYLKERLRMITCRANLGSFCTNNYMSAIPTLPDLDLALLEHFLHLDILQKRTVSATRRNLAASSGNPSSSAVFAKPSYISVHS